MILKLPSYRINFRIETILISIILVVAAVFRLYKIDQYMRFLGDEGRDALAVLHIIRDFHLPLIGPATSVGNMYLGPLYYYMMLLPMGITNLNPVAAAVMVALLSVATVYLLYYAGKIMFSPFVGVAAASLYAIAYLPVAMARSSWNPYPMPFFALLVIISIYKLTETKNPKWVVLTGITFAFVLQMHLLGLILMPLIVLYWIYSLYVFYKAQRLKGFLLYSGLSMILFLVLMSPLALFDVRHDYLNARAFQAYFLHRDTTLNLNPFNTISRMWDTMANLYVARFLTYGYPALGVVLAIIIPILTVLFTVLRFRDQKVVRGVLLLGLWFVIGIVGMSLVKSHIYDHYFGYMMPVIYLIFAFVLWQITLLGKLYYIPAITCLVLILLLYLATSPLTDIPGRQLQRTQTIAKFIIDQSGGRPYNFALISRNNYADGYKFYLEYLQHPFTVIDPQHLQNTQTDQLFVACEDEVCQPINNDRFDIAAFGWSKIDQVMEVGSVKVFKLVKVPPPQQDGKAKI